MEIKIPEFSLVVLIGASGSGKSTFAQKHFKSTEILSSDFFRAMVCDDEGSLAHNADTFDALNYVLEKRLKNKRLTVIDATNTNQYGRKNLRHLAKKYHARLIAIVLDLPEKVSKARNLDRPNRNFGPEVVRRQATAVRKSIKHLKSEGFRYTHVLKSEEEVNAVTIARMKMRSDRHDEIGPFDIIGDVHGCREELELLLGKLGYEIQPMDPGSGLYYAVTHPTGRRVIFVGDLVDRGPDSPGVLKLAMSMVRSKVAFCVPGNHDDKLARKLSGRNVQLKHGLAETMEQMEKESPAFHEEVRDFIQRLSSHLVFNNGDLVVAHAGLKEAMHGRASGEIRSFCLYGETTGETDEYGLPVRLNWAEDYRGDATVIYGHTPVPYAEWLNKTMDIDTGCVFGGKLTALRYPERTVVDVPAAKVYSEPTRPLIPEGESATSLQHAHDEVLDINYLKGHSLVMTRLRYNISVKENDAQAALEIMNRYGINPKWLIYLPPTMSPPKTSSLPGYLEHPQQAFNYFKKKGLASVIVEAKHMGSRAVVILCRDEQVVAERFGIQNEGIGVVYTRTGRAFFKDKMLEQTLLGQLRDAATQAGLWEELETDWLCLDCELLPWSVKADRLIREQYAATGAAGRAALPEAVAALEKAAARGLDTDALAERLRVREQQLGRFIEAYRAYAATATSLADIRLAPFHLMASEGKVHTNQPHLWHLAQIQRLVDAAPELVIPTSYLEVDLDSESSIRAAIAWWEAYTAKGGEGMVVKPSEFLRDDGSDIVQPGMKVRGKEYLRIIYGPEYDHPANLKRLRNRSLKTKRAVAIREFALGHEGLHRFVERKPLNDIHQCAFALLGLESTPIDARL